ncbi:MAG: histidinol-phosphatase HisJ family protein [Acutalibacteraceae bacterium]|nr:histidinol-phosphatase HisJ family protein [Clostridia bacterium]MEE1143876.1 histidinol-phosphatase HisJ family protein [Acutalibacteraceae bacterium]
MIITDVHTHSNASPDGFDSPAEMVESAKAKNIGVLCITDHFEVPEKDEDDYKNIEPKIENTFRFRNTNSENKTLVGIELGGAIYNPEYSKEFLSRHNFDFVLGSLHHIFYDDGPIDYYFLDYTGADTSKMLIDYFEKLYEQSKLLLFDSLAHLDYPTRYMRLKNVPYSLKCCEDQIDAILKLLVENGKALEINTSGLFAPFCDTLPTQNIIDRYCSFGGEFVTVGSDSHKAESLAQGFNKAVAKASKAGIKYLAYYENRQPTMIKI